MREPNNRPTFTSENLPGRAEVRRYGFPSTTLPIAGAAGARAIVSAGEAEVVVLSGLLISNETVSPAMISLGIIDAGEAITVQTSAIRLLSVPPNGFVTLDGWSALNPGQVLWAYADIADALRVSGWVTVYL